MLSKVWCVIRKTLIVLAWIVGLLVLFVLAGGLGPTVKYVGAPIARAMGVPLHIDTCVILPLGGYVRLEGVRVDNPTTFQEAKPDFYGATALAALGTAEVDVRVTSLLSDELVVDTVRVEGIRALYAYDLDTTNVDALLAQLGAGQETRAEVVEEAVETPEELKEEAAETKADPEEFRFRIGTFHLADNQVSIHKLVTLPIMLPPVTLHDVDNATLMEKIGGTLEPIVKTVQGLEGGLGVATDGLNKGFEKAGEGLDKASEKIGEGLDKVGVDLGAVLDGTTDVTEAVLTDSVQAVGEELKKAEDAMKNLFNRK